jgi:hypothetical protein
VAKNKHYEEQLIKYKHDTKVQWKALNEIMNPNKTNSMLTTEFIGRSLGEKITDPTSMANRFNDYFVNIGQGLVKKLSNSKSNFDKYLTIICKEASLLIQ